MKSALILHEKRLKRKSGYGITCKNSSKGLQPEGEHRMRKWKKGNIKTLQVYRVNSLLSLHSLRI